MGIAVKFKQREVTLLVTELGMITLDRDKDKTRLKQIIAKLEVARSVRNKVRKRQLIYAAHKGLKALHVLANGNGGDQSDFNEGGIAFEAEKALREAIGEENHGE